MRKYKINVDMDALKLPRRKVIGHLLATLPDIIDDDGRFHARWCKRVRDASYRMCSVKSIRAAATYLRKAGVLHTEYVQGEGFQTYINKEYFSKV